MYYNTDENECDYDYYLKQFGVFEKTQSRLLSIYGCNILSVQRSYNAQCEGILLDTTKTKKRNDTFASRGLKRRPYLPILSKRLSNFYKV